MLLMSACCHDVGMAVSDEKRERLIQGLMRIRENKNYAFEFKAIPWVRKIQFRKI